MSSRVLLSAFALVVAILLSAGLWQDGAAVPAAAQAGDDPFGESPQPTAAADPFGAVGDDDPFSAKPNETKSTPKSDADNPFADDPAEPPKPLPVSGTDDPFSAKVAAEPVPEPPADPAAADDPFSAKPAPPKPVPPKPPESKGPKPTPTATFGAGEEAIEKALGQTTPIDIVDMALPDVVDFLSSLHEIGIFIDARALSDVGVATDTPITANLKGVSLRSVLDLLLGQLDLTWTIRSEVLLITTQEQANSMLITKAYDVADLVTFRDQSGQLWEDYDALTESITATILPESWDASGGPGSIVGGTFGTAKVMVVSHTYQTHQRIAELLEQLRAIAEKRPSDEQPPRRNRPQWGGAGGMGMGGMGGQGMGGMGGQGMGGMGGQGMGKGMGMGMF